MFALRDGVITAKLLEAPPGAVPALLKMHPALSLPHTPAKTSAPFTPPAAADAYSPSPALPLAQPQTYRNIFTVTVACYRLQRLPYKSQQQHRGAINDNG